MGKSIFASSAADSPDSDGGREGDVRFEMPVDVDGAPRRSTALKEKLRVAGHAAKPTRASFCMNHSRDGIPKHLLSEVIVPIVPGIAGHIAAAPLPRLKGRRSDLERRRPKHANTVSLLHESRLSSSSGMHNPSSGSEDSPRRRASFARSGQESPRVRPSFSYPGQESPRRRPSFMRPVLSERRESGESEEASTDKRRGSRGNSITGVAAPRESLGQGHGHSHRMRAARKEHAILHHRDSLGGSGSKPSSAARQSVYHRATLRTSAAGQALAACAAAAASASRGRRKSKRRAAAAVVAAEQQEEKLRPQPPEDLAVRALKRLAALEGCSNRFFELLAASCERVYLRAGVTREVNSSRISGAQRRPAVAVLVERGTVRIEASGAMLIDEIGPGMTFGLANVMASVSGNTSREGLGIATEFVLRGPSEGCHCVLFTNVAFRAVLTECPEDKARLFGLLHMVSSKADDSTRRILATLQCGEAISPVIAGSLTRHIKMPGDVIAQEGRRPPDGIILLKSGTVELEMGGVKVRQVSDGQVIGEEMMFSVCQKWAVTARCLTPCDMQILHRRLFVALVRELQNGNSEEVTESKRLLVLLEGNWKEERATLSWPLFGGYEARFLSALARHVETRVVLPGVKVWENGLGRQEGREVVLYLILHGTCEEATTERSTRKVEDVTPSEKQAAEGRVAKRILVPGACLGEREFLGLQEAPCSIVVKARRLCLLALLHRSVFLHAVDHHENEQQSDEVKRLLEQELDQTEPPLVNGLHEKIIRGLPLFRGCDRRFVERLCDKVRSRYFIGGQLICRSGVDPKEMLIVARGEVLMTLAGLEIRRYVRGKALNILALSEHFAPAYALTCERACEVWTLAREEFTAAVDTFPLDRRRLSVLLDSENLPALSPDADEQTTQVAKSSSGSGALSFEKVQKPSPDQLSKVEVLSGCSAAMLKWIRAHLETTVCFPDEVIYREGSEDESMYIICSGMVIVQGMKEQSQTSLASGATFGEQRLLEVVERAKATVTAVEITVLQVLHRCVLAKGLELFPGDAAHFDRVAVSWLNASDGQDTLAKVPLLSSCSAEFLAQVGKHVHMSLVHKGGVINEGSSGERLCILRSGAALAEERAVSMLVQPTLSRTGPQRRFIENQAVNADVVLGLVRRPGPLIRAERVCILAEIPAAHVLAALQRHPQEVKRLVQHAAGGTLWPSEVESVPFFRGMGPAFFTRLMEVSEWAMFLPDQTVVKQNGTGNVLFLLSYGTAVTRVDGMVVGHPLSPGDVVGTANFLRVCDRYRTTVRTQSVCHFRTLGPWHLDKVLPEHAAERERVEGLRQQVQQNLSREEKTLHLQASREKLKQRADGAFRRHIGVVRGVRGVGQGEQLATRSEAGKDVPHLSPGGGPAESEGCSSASQEGSGSEADEETSPGSRHTRRSVVSEGSESEESDFPRSPARGRRSHFGKLRKWSGTSSASRGSLSASRALSAARGSWLLRQPKDLAAAAEMRDRLNSSATSGDSEDDGSGGSFQSSSDEGAWGKSRRSSASSYRRRNSASTANSRRLSAGTRKSSVAIDEEDEPVDPGPASPQKRIAVAISEYTEGKKDALLKARVLRLYRGGMPLDGSTRSTPRLASPEMTRLESLLPPLAPVERLGEAPATARATKMTTEERERLLQARFQELSSAASGASLSRSPSKR